MQLPSCRNKLRGYHVPIFRHRAANPDGSPGLFRPFQQERDRQIFDPRDYKIESLRGATPLVVFKKWRHEVEICIDTIGPSWNGVRQVIQQLRHSDTPLLPTSESMAATLFRATAIARGLPPLEHLTMDWSGKATTLYKMFIPK